MCRKPESAFSRWLWKGVPPEDRKRDIIIGLSFLAAFLLVMLNAIR